MSQRVVVDASVVVGWLLGEDTAFELARPVLEVLKSARMLVPAIWQSEIANVLVVRERQKRIDEATFTRSIRLLEDLGPEVDILSATAIFDRVVPLARRHQLTSYDAAYLELALRERAPLATFDAALSRAAEREGVETLLRRP